jgi:hypothetical protein
MDIMIERDFQRYIAREWNNIITSKELIDNHIRCDIINFSTLKISSLEKELNRYNWNSV